MDIWKRIHRLNIDRAEEMGLLESEKRIAGAPLDWKLVSTEEIEAIKFAGLPYIPRVIAGIQGPVATGWAPGYVYDMIIAWEMMGERYADLTLGDWLMKTITK